MTELDLRHIPIEDFTRLVLSERANKYYEQHESLPDVIYLTLDQKRTLRSPSFEPYSEWRGIPLTVK